MKFASYNEESFGGLFLGVYTKVVYIDMEFLPHYREFNLNFLDRLQA